MSAPYETEVIEAPELNIVSAIRMMFDDDDAPDRNRFVVIDLSVVGDWRCIRFNGCYAVYPTSLAASTVLGIVRSLMKEEPTDAVMTAVVDIERSRLVDVMCHAGT